MISRLGGRAWGGGCPRTSPSQGVDRHWGPQTLPAVRKGKAIFIITQRRYFPSSCADVALMGKLGASAGIRL